MEQWVPLCIILSLAGCEAGIYKDMFDFVSNKLTMTIPLADHGRPMPLIFHLRLWNIDRVDKDKNTISFIATKREKWLDENLNWDPKDHHGIRSVYLVTKDTWVPDLVLYNAAAPDQVIVPNQVLVIFYGHMMSAAEVRWTAHCDVSGVDTYSGATCELEIGSWAFNSEKVFLKAPEGDVPFTTNGYYENSKYEILSSSSRKELRNPKCCTSVEKNLTYDTWVMTFTFRRKARR